MQQALDYIKTQLASIYSEPELRILSEQIIESCTGMTRIQMLLNRQEEISPESRGQLTSIVDRLAAHEPIQYILGKTHFYGLPFHVDPNVLIPRPETTELLEYILSLDTLKDKKDFYCLDIGTGSGCIPIVLKHFRPNWQMEAFDISTEALEMARRNAELNHVEIEFHKVDILSASGENYARKFNMIISNPPYICESEKEEMESNVLDHEPHLALFVPNENPLLFYDTIATFAQKSLHTDGLLLFEINRKYGNMTCEMLESKGFTDITLHQDISGNDRYTSARIAVYQ